MHNASNVVTPDYHRCVSLISISSMHSVYIRLCWLANVERVAVISSVISLCSIDVTKLNSVIDHLYCYTTSGCLRILVLVPHLLLSEVWFLNSNCEYKAGHHRASNQCERLIQLTIQCLRIAAPTCQVIHRISSLPPSISGCKSFIYA